MSPQHSSSLEVVPAAEENALLTFAGVPFGIRMVAPGHRFEEPVLFAATEVSRMIGHLVDLGCLNTVDAAWLLSDLEALKGRGMLNTVDDLAAAVAAKSAPTSEDVFCFEMCPCGKPEKHGYIYVKEREELATGMVIVGRGPLLAYLSAWVSKGMVTAQNACNIVAQAADLPMLPEGYLGRNPQVPIPDDVVEKLRAHVCDQA